MAKMSQILQMSRLKNKTLVAAKLYLSQRLKLARARIHMEQLLFQESVVDLQIN